MFTRYITMQEFADLFEELVVEGSVVAGAFYTVAGRHPDLGAVVVTQGMAEASYRPSPGRPSLGRASP